MCLVWLVERLHYYEVFLLQWWVWPVFESDEFVSGEEDKDERGALPVL